VAGADVSAPEARPAGTGRSFDRAVAWNAVSKVSTRLVLFLVTIVLARLLTPADFGLVGMAAIVTGLVAMFAEFGFASALIQKLQVTEDDIATAWTSSILLGLVVTLACVLLAPLAARLFRSDQLVGPLQGSALGILVVSFGITPRALLYRRMDFRSTAIADVGGAAVYGAVGIGMALAGAGVKRGDRVVLHAPKSVSGVAAVYGIMKCGAAYVPVEPGSPGPRVADIVAQCRPRAVVTWSKAREKLGWEPRTTFRELVETMVDGDLQRLSATGRPVAAHGSEP
jgi:hypothetical protein